MPDNAAVTSSTSVQHADSSSFRTQQVLVIFTVSGENAALPIQNVERITSMARLARPPGLPAMLEGILNLEGTAVPVVRLDRLFQLNDQPPGLYSMLMVMKGVTDHPLALLVDRVDRIAAVPESAVLPLEDRSSFNACAEATVRLGEQVIHLLSPAQILLAAERTALHEFQEMAQRRLQGWDLDQR